MQGLQDIDCENTGIDADTVDRRVRRWLELFALAARGGSVSAACRFGGCTRSSFYRARDWYEQGGITSLRELVVRSLIRRPEIAQELDQSILKLTREHPNWGRVRIAKALRTRGLPISASRVRATWSRHGLLSESAIESSVDTSTVCFAPAPQHATSATEESPALTTPSVNTPPSVTPSVVA